MNFRDLGIGTVLGMGLLGSPAAHADVILTYTGNDFTSVSAPYTTNDKVTATIDLASALLPNQPETQVFPVTFSLNDGVQTITNLTTGVNSAFFFETGSSGNIVAWDDIAEIGTQMQSTRILTQFDSGLKEDLGLIHTPTIVSGSNQNDPGTWNATVAVPAPLIGHGLLVFIAVGGVLFGSKLLERRREARLQSG